MHGRGNIEVVTGLGCLRDAYLRSFHGTVSDARDDAGALDRNAFYATGDGPPNDAQVWPERLPAVHSGGRDG
jgi:hypothetical protein